MTQLMPAAAGKARITSIAHTTRRRFHSKRLCGDGKNADENKISTAKDHAIALSHARRGEIHKNVHVAKKVTDGAKTAIDCGLI